MNLTVCCVKQSANGDQLGKAGFLDFQCSPRKRRAPRKGEPFYSQIAVEVPIFWMIVEAFCTLKTFGRLDAIRFTSRVEIPRNQGVEAHDPGHSTRRGTGRGRARLSGHAKPIGAYTP